jgi:hypothetical protein
MFFLKNISNSKDFHFNEIISSQNILDCKEAQDRLLLSYKMMLDFYGMKLENEKDGTITTSDNWEERFIDLNR